MSFGRKFQRGEPRDDGRDERCEQPRGAAPSCAARARHRVAGALLSVLMLAGPAFAADGHVALLKSVTGSVQILRGAAVLTAAAGDTLVVSDRLVSGAAASSGIVFKDGTSVVLGPNSDIHVRDYVFEPKESKYQFSVFLAKGAAVYSSGKIGKLAPESVQVGTPTATVGVRGTRFIIEAE